MGKSKGLKYTENLNLNWEKVRLAYDESSFRKGYKPQFTDKVYTVEKIVS